LSDYNRLGIIRFICEKENGILETKRIGPFIFYYLRDKKILEAINLFLELFKNSEIKYKTNSKFCSGWIISNYDNKT